MTNQPLPLSGARPTFPEDDITPILSEIAEVLRGGRLILGPKLRAMEEAWAKYVGVKHAVGVSSCTAALEIAFRFYGVEGKEVIVPTNTFVATANAAIAAGAKVVFCDMSADDYCLDVDDALSKVTDETAAIVAVHISGFISRRTDDLRSACAARGIKLIEDCAHAHGSTLEGRQAGALGDVGCFSLYPTKVLTCGVGGVVTTDDDALAAFARSMRHHGQGASLEAIENPGNDWMLDEVRAVLAHAQLKRLPDFLAARRALAARYGELVAGDVRFTIPQLGARCSPAFYKYPVLLPEGVDAGAVRRRVLETDRIEIGSLYYPPCHLMPVFRKRLGTGPGMLKTAESLLARQVCLPMHVAVDTDAAARSVDAVRRALSG